eukprot:scpid58039/ scgid31587/ 
MGELLAIACVIVFIVAQAFQGVAIDFLLCLQRGNAQLLWLIADGVLLLVWLTWLARYRRNMAWKEIVTVPLLALGYSLYCILCVIPRLAIFVSAVRSDLHESNKAPLNNTECYLHNNSSQPLDVIFGWADHFSSNVAVSFYAVTITLMLIALVTSLHAQHGLSSKYALRYDTSSQLFAVMDGISLLQMLFDSFQQYFDNHCSSGIPHDAVPPTTQSQDQNSRCPFPKIMVEGQLGTFVLVIALSSFVIPVLGLWQMKRESSKLKADEKLKRQIWSTILRRTASQGSQMTDVPRMPKEKKQTQRPPTRRGILKRGTERVKTWRRKGRTMIRRMAKKRVHEEKRVYNKMQRDIKILSTLHSLWDFFTINLCSLIIRLIIWNKYGQNVSVLIVKNMVIIYFGILDFTLTYLQPFYRRVRGLHKRQESRKSHAPDLRCYAMATDVEAVPEMEAAAPRIRPFSQRLASELDVLRTVSFLDLRNTVCANESASDTEETVERELKEETPRKRKRSSTTSQGLGIQHEYTSVSVNHTGDVNGDTSAGSACTGSAVQRNDEQETELQTHVGESARDGSGTGGDAIATNADDATTPIPRSANGRVHTCMSSNV